MSYHAGEEDLQRAVEACRRNGLPVETFFHGFNPPAGALLCSDSRVFRPGDLFACVRGGAFDGHDFALQALERGASGLLLERPMPGVDGPRAITPNVRAAMGYFAAALAGEPLKRLQALAVTGSNGKTSSAVLLRHLLAACNVKSGLLGTLWYDDGVRCDQADRTTPESSALQDWFARMVVNGCGAVVMETSSHGLVQGRLNGCMYDGAVFTNLSPEHLDFHGTMEGYFQAKSLLVTRYLKNGAPLVLCASTPWGRRMSELTDRPVTWGIEEKADLEAYNVRLQSDGSTFDLRWKGKPLGRVVLPLVARFNLENALGATALLLELGYDGSALCRALAQAPTVPGRMNKLTLETGVTVLVDFAHTPKALESVLTALRPLTRRLISVFGHGGSRSQEVRPLLGAAADRYADRIFLTSDNCRDEDPAEIAAHIASGITDQSKVTVRLDRVEAVNAALDSAGPGDIVVITGKGAETALEVKGVKHPYNDEVQVRAWAAEKGVKVQ